MSLPHHSSHPSSHHFTHHSSLITHYSLLITHYSLLVTHHSSFITHHFHAHSLSLLLDRPRAARALRAGGSRLLARRGYRVGAVAARIHGTRAAHRTRLRAG